MESKERDETHPNFHNAMTPPATLRIKADNPDRVAASKPSELTDFKPVIPDQPVEN